MRKYNIAVLISGGGTNLQAIINATKNGEVNAEIVLVISNKADAYGITRAKDAGIPICVIDHRQFSSREAFDMEMDQVLTSTGVEFICLAGFMRILSDWFVDKWQGKMINIHPSLLPSFKGENAQAQALEYGVKITGTTVHYVTKEMDSGPIIAQEAVEILPGDNVDILRARLLIVENKLYPQALNIALKQLEDKI